jgi:hypothetical protein
MEPSLRIELKFHPYQGCVLPLNYDGLEPIVGIEPTLDVYETSVLPLNYIGFCWVIGHCALALSISIILIRPMATRSHDIPNIQIGRGRGIRTPARSSQGSRATVEHYPTKIFGSPCRNRTYFFCL